jgi:zinc protease
MLQRIALCLLTFWLCVNSAAALAAEYAVVVSRATADDPGWSRVVQALESQHKGRVIVFDGDVRATLNELQQQFPRYTCFVAQPHEATREFVATVHQLTRQLDDDPYTDTFWGILTGYDSDNALAIAQHTQPLTIRKVASGTDISLEMCEQGKWFCELEAGKVVSKSPGAKIEVSHGEADSTAAIVETLNEYKPDLFVTSGHATERDWQIGFRYRNGSFRSRGGQMVGLDLAGNQHVVDSQNTKVYLPIGNCLMGHIDSTDAMALAWLNDVGVKQMIGYTVPTWFGYAGWGVLDYFVEQPGRYTLTEAFFANQHALIHAIETGSGDKRGLTFDRDVVAFYGNPAWQARMAASDCYYDQSLEVHEGVYTLTITPRHGADSFRPVNTNGSQRGYRPFVAYLPQRVHNVQIIEGGDLKPLVTDNFVLVPNPQAADPQRSYVVRFSADVLK